MAAAILGHKRPRVHRLSKVPGQLVGAICFARLELLADATNLIAVRAGRYVSGLDASLHIHPAHRHQFRILIDQRFSLESELLGVDLPVSYTHLTLPTI